MAFTEFDGELDKAPVQGTFTEFDGELDAPDPKRELPAGVKPSEGRGKGVPIESYTPPAPQGPGRTLADIKSTKRAVDQERDTMPQFFNRGGPLADDNAMRRVAQETGQVGTPGYSQLDPATQAPRIPKQQPQELRSNENTIYPTGGVVEAVKVAPGIAARGLAESALTVGKVLADFGVTVPGGPSAREFGEMSTQFEKGNRRATMALSDKNLVDMGPLLNSVVPSARTVGEGLSEVGRQVALNVVLPGGIIVDAGFKGVKEAQMAGMTPGAALLVGVLKAGTEGVPEHFSAKFALKEGANINVGAMLKDPKIALEATKRFGAAMGVELTSEQGSAVSSWLVDKMTNDPSATLDRLGTDMTDAIKSTLVQAPGMMAAGKIGSSAMAAAHKITAFDIAAQRGFNVDPPYATDPPDVQRKKTVGIFNAAVAQYGIDPDAAKRATEAANSMPAEMAGPFLARMAEALQKRQMVGKPVESHALDVLKAAPIEDPKIAEAAAKVAETEAKSTVSGKSGTQAGEKPSEPATSAGLSPETEDLTGLSEPSSVDTAAHAAAPSPKNDLPEPTTAQALAGNYQKGHAKVGGLDVSIENPEGSTRRDKNNDPPQWESTMTSAHYGYIRGTVSMDGEHIDTFIKPGTPDAFDGTAFVIDQIDPATGKPDEHKVMVGFETIEEARAAYLANYTKDWKGLGAITAAPMADLKTWLREGDTKKPYGSAQPDVQPTPGQPAASAAGGSAQPAGSGGTVGRSPASAGRESAAPAAAPVAGSPAAEPVRDGAGGAPAAVGRVIARAGRMPNSAKPIELRPAGTDGKMLSAWHDGYELVDFDSGAPVQIPADVTDAQAFEAVKKSGAFGKSTKFFDAPKAETPSAPVEKQEVTPAPAPITSPADSGVKEPEQGKIGGKMAADQVVRTSSGRSTTPFPKVSVDTERKAQNTVRAVDQWLMANALAEAQARGDDFNARQFEANAKKPSQSDKDSAEEYLFGEQPAVVPSILKPLVDKPAEPPVDKAAETQEQVPAKAQLPIPAPAAPMPPAVPKVAQLSDSEAFSDDYASFEGRTVEQTVSISDTGGVAQLRIDARRAMIAIDTRLKTLTELKSCIGRRA